MSEFPKIVTFYSFKGGVGRSMAVLNTAYALAARGRHVLVLDMDLEAPGLSGFLRREKEIDGAGRLDIVDLLGWASNAARAADDPDAPIPEISFPPLSDYVVSVPAESIQDVQPEAGSVGRLDIIPVDESRDYYGRLTGLSIGGFDREALLRTGSLLRSYLNSRVVTQEVPDYYGPDAPRTVPYDYVLVDSRTGVTEIGGLCIGPLSDMLVVLTALNDQNVEGTRGFLEEVGVLAPRPQGQPNGGQGDNPPPPNRLDPKPTLIVASPVPAGELKTKQERLDKLRAAVGKVVLKLSYHPQMALFETVFVRDHHDEYLTQKYLRLVDKLLEMAGDVLDTSILVKCMTLKWEKPEARRKILRHCARHAVQASAIMDELIWLGTLLSRDEFRDMEDMDFILLDRLFCVQRPQFHTPRQRDTWSEILLRWCKQTEDTELAILRGSASVECYSALIESPAADDEKAKALLNRGLRYEQLNESEKAIADYTAVVDMPDAPAAQKAQALSGRGWCSYMEKQVDRAIADYRQAIKIVPNHCNALGNLAVALLVAGRTDEALDAYAKALDVGDPKAISDMEADLNEATAEYGDLPGADQALEQLKARLAQLETLDST